MTRLWLVRHGPTHAKAMIGWTDLPADLSDTAALARLSDALPAAPVVSSDLSRAQRTADAICGARPRLPDEPALREIHFGAWEGLHFSKAEARDPYLIRAFWEEPGHVCAPAGESWNGLTRRVHAAIDRLAGDRDDLIVVAHFGVILSLVQRAAGETAVAVMARKIDPLSLTEIHIDAGEWRLLGVNRQP